MKSMAKLMSRVKKFLLTNEAGATAVEYGLLVALIAVVIIGVVTLLGGQLRNVFQTVVNALPGGG
jgi:pilus assembly protein Flp/PilA